MRAIERTRAESGRAQNAAQRFVDHAPVYFLDPRFARIEVVMCEVPTLDSFGLAPAEELPPRKRQTLRLHRVSPEDREVRVILNSFAAAS